MAIARYNGSTKANALEPNVAGLVGIKPILLALNSLPLAFSSKLNNATVRKERGLSGSKQTILINTQFS